MTDLSNPPTLPDISDSEDDTTSTTAQATAVASAAIGGPAWPAQRAETTTAAGRAEARTRVPRAGYVGLARRSTSIPIGVMQRGMVSIPAGALVALAAEPFAYKQHANGRVEYPPAVGDMKAGLTSDRAKLSILPTAAKLYLCRALEYGAEKYRRGNYHGAPPAGVSPVERVLGYLDAAQRHSDNVTDAINRALGTNGDAEAAVATADLKVGGGFPASALPDLAHMIASVGLAIQCAVDDGLLPADPGQPWRNGRVTDTRSPEAVERFTFSGFDVIDEDADEVLAHYATEDEANTCVEQIAESGSRRFPNVIVKPHRIRD